MDFRPFLGTLTALTIPKTPSIVPTADVQVYSMLSRMVINCLVGQHGLVGFTVMKKLQT